MTCCGMKRRTVASAFPAGVALALLPKCPMCLAAWLAAATGVTVSAGNAAVLKTVVLGTCVVSAIAVLLYRRERRRAS